MKQKKWLLLNIVCILIAALAGTAQAETSLANGLRLALRTDRETYTTGETIECWLDISNAGEMPAAIEYELILPEGVQAPASSRDIVQIVPGGSESRLFSVHVNARGADDLPTTGDFFPLFANALLLVLSAAVGAWLMGRKRWMAAILVCTMAAGSLAAPDHAFAQQYCDAFCQTEYSENITEEAHLKQLDEQEQMILSAMPEEDPCLLQTSESFEVNHTIAVDGQLITIKVVGTSRAVDAAVDAATIKALGTVSLKPITILGKTKFKLTWSKVPGATHYEVWHSDGSGYIKRATTIGTSWTTNYGKYGVINTYKVRAITKEGNTITAKGPYSTRTCYGMAQPSLSAVEHTSTASEDVRVRWNAASYCTGYYVYRSFTGEPGTYSFIGKSTTTSFVDRWRNGYYKIRPYYTAANGITYSGPASAMKNMPAQYRALVIGQTYPDWADGQLPGCANDAFAMQIMLGSMKAPAYRAVDTKVHLNLTADGILKQIKTAFQRAKANDVSLFYYSGHGAADGSLCGAVRQTYISIDQLKAALDAVPGKKIVILDSCYSGQAIDKAAGETAAALTSFNQAVMSAFAVAEKDNLANSSYYVMTACTQNQTSAEITYISNQKSVGLFTSQMLYGSGVQMLTDTVLADLYADSDGDRQLTLHEVYSYAADRVQNVADQLGLVQDAQVYPTFSAQVLWGR